jgi:hypothetical protein
MAHECPQCGMTCYCNGDIDDCLLDDAEAEAECKCCLDKLDLEEDHCDLLVKERVDPVTPEKPDDKT